MPDGFKTCGACKETKPLSEFYSRANRRPNRRTERTYNYRCKECDKAWQRDRNASFANLGDARVLPETQRCSRCEEVKPAEAFALNRTRRTGLQGVCYACHRDRRYGLLPGQFDQLMADQDGKCAICRQTCPRQMELSVDHDHATGKVRGLLCQNCNAALGMFKDDPALLSRAIDYLKAASDA